MFSKTGQIGIGAIVGIMVVIIVATSLLPTISSTIATYTAANGTGSALLSNVPLFVVIGVLLAGVVGAGMTRLR
jgi:hypothetical protein